MRKPSIHLQQIQNSCRMGKFRNCENIWKVSRPLCWEEGQIGTSACRVFHIVKSWPFRNCSHFANLACGLKVMHWICVKEFGLM